ncbi:MAG: regulatory signaling modulator protein AmpE [Gammaproteobacteria bacterium]|nr:regulatory signaling modulator protein AmpE [Gammaproteobacteria bacterium]MDH5651132.1 regulatory signaling modulator protein AmpE [Gammaproteobacteria bacterium]
MSLISILISLAIESYWDKVDSLRQYDWFESYRNWISEKLAGQTFLETPFGVLAVVLPPVLLVWLVDSMFGGVLWLFSFLIGIVVLVYCIGPRSLVRDVQAYLDAVEAGDHTAARQHAAGILNRPVDEKEKELAQIVKEAILVQANDRLIGVLFWFALLGPVGAVLYRTSVLLKDQTAFEAGGFASAAQDLYWVMNWLPTRISILGYALAGNFIDTTSYWDSITDFWTRDSTDLLIASGIGALRQDLRADVTEHSDEYFNLGVSHALALIKRTVIVFITLLALMTLTGLLL